MNQIIQTVTNTLEPVAKEHDNLPLKQEKRTHLGPANQSIEATAIDNLSEESLLNFENTIINNQLTNFSEGLHKNQSQKSEKTTETTTIDSISQNIKDITTKITTSADLLTPISLEKSANINTTVTMNLDTSAFTTAAQENIAMVHDSDSNIEKKLLNEENKINLSDEIDDTGHNKKTSDMSSMDLSTEQLDNLNKIEILNNNSENDKVNFEIESIEFNPKFIEKSNHDLKNKIKEKHTIDTNLKSINPNTSQIENKPDNDEDTKLQNHQFENIKIIEPTATYIDEPASEIPNPNADMIETNDIFLENKSSTDENEGTFKTSTIQILTYNNSNTGVEPTVQANQVKTEEVSVATILPITHNYIHEFSPITSSQNLVTNSANPVDIIDDKNNQESNKIEIAQTIENGNQFEHFLIPH